ncbi:hypothetical protein [Rheinheimera sp. 4Y26]|uniref:hypothetical protein n=1 Tax=Rheinheimera sp. 4Y26 TaxID=2977811 RepID=UPI0021B0A824|nr:hypothetical protein [Rheinheimera sp. 4Y26]MCT6700035.1 hypothetical protein [Rheinheimera sp. 4Y26]
MTSKHKEHFAQQLATQSCEADKLTTPVQTTAEHLVYPQADSERQVQQQQQAKAGTNSAAAAGSEQLTAELELWYRQSAQQHQMPQQQKQLLLQQLQQRARPKFRLIQLQLFVQQLAGWFSFAKLQALTAVCALGLGWFLIQQQQQLSYQISQINSLYPVQIHQLNSEEVPAGSLSAALQRQQIFSQSYQDYQQSVAAGHVIKQQVLARQSADSGWLLDACSKLRLQLSEGWLAQFKVQQQWTEPQWAQLAASRYLKVSTGAQGEIIALQASANPPSCAP